MFRNHAITKSHPDASELSNRLNDAGLQSMWPMSCLPPAQKSLFIQWWEDDQEQVFFSTFTNRIDNSATKDDIIVGGTYSIYSQVQAIGRIRPKGQNFIKSSIYIFYSSSYVQLEEQSVDANFSTW